MQHLQRSELLLWALEDEESSKEEMALELDLKNETQGILKMFPAVWAAIAKHRVWLEESWIGMSKKDKTQMKPIPNGKEIVFLFPRGGQR